MPNDFRLKTTYGVGVDWPIWYDELEPLTASRPGARCPTGSRSRACAASPDFQFRTQFALSSDQAELTAALRRAEELLRPVLDFVRERSRAGARGRALETNLRTEVVARWQEAEHPTWTAAETLSVAEEVDAAYVERDLNPAPRFRVARVARDMSYLQTWLAGCHFDWLNPRRI